MLASSAYAICVPLVWLASKFNLIAREPAWILVAMMVVVNLGLYAVFRAGLNRKFTDPNLTWAQVFVGNVVVMYAVYSFDQGRAVVLNLSLVVLWVWVTCRLCWVFRAGLNRHFPAPILPWAQFFVGNVLVLSAVYSVDRGLAVVLSLGVVVLIFGVFH